MLIFMDFLSLKVYKGLEIKKWNARLIYRDGFQNPGKEFTLSQLFMCKFTFLYILILSNLENMTNGLTVLGPIGN